MKMTVIILASLTVAFLASACSIKTGVADLKSNDIQKFDPNFADVWEIEGHSPRFLKEHVDVSGSVSTNSIESKGELQTTQGTISEYSSKLFDFRLTTRLYPLGDKVIPLIPGAEWGLIPYVGGGIGYYKLESTTKAPGARATCPPSHSFGFTCYEIVEKDTTLADGIYGHAVAGLYIPLHSYIAGQTNGIVGLVIEDRYDFRKTDGHYNLGGNLFLVGLTLRFL
ncbi:MAG: hypothetical protein MRJ68_11775 [Nitrospira sp.]|nr:hypothetical protein [Nitrospira sp.]